VKVCVLLDMYMLMGSLSLSLSAYVRATCLRVSGRASVHLYQEEDFESYVLRRGFANLDEKMDLVAFKTWIYYQLKQYVQKQMAKAAGSLFFLLSVCLTYADCDRD
jgi:hypothetical protein